MREQSDASATGHALGTECIGCTIDRLIQLGIGPAQVPIDDGRLFGKSSGAPGEQFADAVLAYSLTRKTLDALSLI
jgi:hypothetical protein